VSKENMRTVRRVILVSERGIRQDGNNNIIICCTRCAQWKALGEFGLRYMANEDTLRNQSHCTECRHEQLAGAPL